MMPKIAQGSSKSPKQENTGPWPEDEQQSLLLTLFSKLVFFLGRRKGKNKTKTVCTFPGSQDLILWPTCELSLATKKPYKILNWNFTKAKKHGMHTGSYFAPMPSRGFSCDIPIQWSCSPTVRTRPHHRRKTWEAIWMLIL